MLAMRRWVCVVDATGAACTGLVQSYGGLLATRFLLGFFEAPVCLWPCVFGLDHD